MSNIKRVKVIVVFSFLLFLCSHLSAQVYIQGTVVDKDTKKAIPDVIVQYGSSDRAFTYTDAKGRFRIPENSETIIYFQCFGYKAKSIPRTTIIQNPTVVLEVSPLSLDPVVISPDDADKLLDEAMINTKKNLLLETPVTYLLHFLETKNIDTLQNEVYMKYATTLKERDLKKNMKRDRVPYLFNLIDIKRMQRTEVPTSDMYGAEYHASHLFTFGKSVNNETYKSYSPDSTFIILRIEPLKGREGWAKGEITINRADMAIVSMEVESVDSLMESQSYKRHMGKQVKTLRKKGNFSFRKYGDRYYMSECLTYYKFGIINEFDRKEEVSYFCESKFRGFAEKKQLRKRKLSGFCQELFYFPDSTDRLFWLDAFDEELATQYDGSGIAANKIPQKDTWKKVLKYSFFAVPVAAAVLFVK